MTISNLLLRCFLGILFLINFVCNCFALQLQDSRSTFKADTPDPVKISSVELATVDNFLLNKVSAKK